MSEQPRLRGMMNESEPIITLLLLEPLTAKLAEQAGFRALSLGAARVRPLIDADTRAGQAMLHETTDLESPLAIAPRTVER